MQKIIHSKIFYTPTGRKRSVEVREHRFGGYEVFKFEHPKSKSGLIVGTWTGYFTNKQKAIKKANSLARKQVFGISLKNKNKKSYIEYGVFPIKRLKVGKKKHYHVIVLQGDKENISIGLTSKNKRGDLLPVKYSNKGVGFMKRTASREFVKYYDNKLEKFNIDKESENKAYRIAMNKLLKDIGHSQKSKRRNEKNRNR